MAKAQGKAGRRKASRDYQVFVSHATGDKWIAKRICEQLEKAGAATFRDDRDIDGGDDIPNEIRVQINRSKEMVVLLTPLSVNREWVTLEIGAAWGRSERYRIVVVLCHEEVESIPAILKSKKAISLDDFEAYVAEVGTRVQGQMR